MWNVKRNFIWASSIFLNFNLILQLSSLPPPPSHPHHHFQSPSHSKLIHPRFNHHHPPHTAHHASSADFEFLFFHHYFFHAPPGWLQNNCLDWALKWEDDEEFPLVGDVCVLSFYTHSVEIKQNGPLLSAEALETCARVGGRMSRRRKKKS